MNDTNQTPCRCAACPGPTCRCGCQQPAEPKEKACACGPQCQCGTACNCPKT